MSSEDKYVPTVRIRRPTKVATDERGHTVWVGEVEEIELELMSTVELKEALATSEGIERDSIEAIAKSNKQGVVARDRATGVYSIISRAEIQEIMKDRDVSPAVTEHLEKAIAPAREDTSRELSLASTQALRILMDDEKSESQISESGEDRGFDPYDKS